MSQNEIFDVIIIGGGPAGYTAALYCTRAGLSTLVLEKFSPGGQMLLTSQIDNYPGFDEGIDGISLAEKMKNGAERFGARTQYGEVLSADLKAIPKAIVTDSGKFLSKSVIIATGAQPRRLGVEGESELVGRGLGYCAHCDGMLFRQKTVAVVGGGNSAAADALLLSKICKKVYVIHRRDSLRAEKIYHEPLMQAENVEFKWNCEVDAFLFERKITGAVLKNKSGHAEELALDGIFISIGRAPVTDLFKGQVALDENGYVIAGEDTKTSLDGVFAVGDVRTKEVRQIVTAVADGASACHKVQEYLARG